MNLRDNVLPPATCTDARLLAGVVADASGLSHFEEEAAAAGAELAKMRGAHADILSNMRKLVWILYFSLPALPSTSGGAGKMCGGHTTSCQTCASWCGLSLCSLIRISG